MCIEPFDADTAPKLLRAGVTIYHRDKSAFNLYMRDLIITAHDKLTSPKHKLALLLAQRRCCSILIKGVDTWQVQS